MKRKRRIVSAALLAAAMLLGLSGCAQNTAGTLSRPASQGETSVEATEMVYTYENWTLEEGLTSSAVFPLCYTEDGVYCQVYEAGADAPAVPLEADDGATEAEGEKEETEQATESPEPTETLIELEGEGESDDSEAKKPATEEVIVEQEYTSSIIFLGYDGSFRRLDGYRRIPAPEDTEERVNYYSGSSLDGLSVAKDGSLIARESCYASWFDGTEAEMLRETPDTWEKYKSEQEYYLRRLNEDGSEQSQVKLDYKAGDAWLNFAGGQLTEDGTLLVVGSEGLFGFDEEGKLCLKISCGDYSLDQLLQLRDGSFAVCGYTDTGMALYPVDLEKKTLAEPVELPSNAYQVMCGFGDYDLVYRDGNQLMGYQLQTKQKEKILSWTDVDVSPNSLEGVHCRQNGEIICLLNQYGGEKVRTELVRVFQAPADSIPQKETLTLAVLYGYDIMDKVVQFNRQNSKVHIQLVDYSQLFDSSEDNFTASRDKLITEMLSGQMPDLIAMDQLPYRQLASKGLLEDLYPYLESDKELSREDYFPNVLKALEVNGGLYQVTAGFNVQTLSGPAKVVGTVPGWNYQEMWDALEQMPEGCELMDMYTTRSDMLRTLLCANMDAYVDWSTGKCSFDSQDFLDMLRFAASFPEEIPDDLEWESSSDRISQGRQMLSTAYLYSVDSMIWNDVQFGKDGCTFIGYPTNKGVGSVMFVSSGYAMSSSCKDKEAAWEFLRSFITYEAQHNAWNGIPLSLKVYREKLDEAMKINYETDENGEPLLDPQGQKIPIPIASFPGEDGEDYEIFCMSQEQADKLWDAVTSCEKVWEENDAVYSIVNETAQAFFAGQKSAEDVAKLIQSKVTIYVNEQR